MNLVLILFFIFGLFICFVLILARNEAEKIKPSKKELKLQRRKRKYGF